MAGLTSDTQVYRYGTEDGDQPVAYPVGSAQTVYYGGVALVSGSGSVTTGYLKNAATAGSADLVVGMIDDPAGGTYVKTQAGITGTSTNGGVWVNVMRGAFYFQSGTGSNALTEANVGLTVYYGGENSAGPIANATGAGTSPILGILLPQDPAIGAATGAFIPGSSYWPVRLNPAIAAS